MKKYLPLKPPNIKRINIYVIVSLLLPFVFFFIIRLIPHVNEMIEISKGHYVDQCTGKYWDVIKEKPETAGTIETVANIVFVIVFLSIINWIISAFVLIKRLLNRLINKGGRVNNI